MGKYEEENLQPSPITDEDLKMLLTAKEVGNRIRFMRLKRGLRGDEVSEMLGIDRSTFSGYETQNRYPPTKVLTRIAKLLNTSTDFLVGLTDNPFPIDTPRNLKDIVEDTDGLHWNGIPLTEETLKPLSELFNIIVKEKVASQAEHKEESSK